MPAKSQTSQDMALLRLPGLLRKAGRSPSVETIHKLRTTIRRLETALKTDFTVPKGLLKQLKHTRKRAGLVRDIDVQLEILKSLGGRNHADVISVRRALIRKRDKQESKLTKIIRAELGKNLQKNLLLAAARNERHRIPAQVHLDELAASFLAERRSQPLSPDNLHGFRVACKQLRYRAELATPSSSRDGLIKELRRVQDVIGTWHDYVTLTESAKRVLGSEQGTSLQRHLHVLAHARYLDALRIVKDVERVLEGRFGTLPRKPSRSVSSVLARSAFAS